MASEPKILSATVSHAVRAFQSAGLGDEEKAILKATYDDLLPPKVKHVEWLIDISQRDPSLDILGPLVRRLGHEKWNVVLKALIVLHRLVMEGSSLLLEALTKKRALNNILGHFLDDRNTESRGQSRFIRLYSNYLTEKIQAFKKLGRSHEREPLREGNKWASALSIPSLTKALPVVQVQFDKLIDCKPFTVEGQMHAIAAKSEELLLKDSLRLYSLLNSMMLVVLDKFQEMDMAQLDLIITCSKEYQEQNGKFKEWATILSSMGLVSPSMLPDFATIPADFIPLISQHASNVKKQQDEERDMPELKVKKKKKKGEGIASPASSSSPPSAAVISPKQQPVQDKAGRSAGAPKSSSIVDDDDPFASSSSSADPLNDQFSSLFVAAPAPKATPAGKPQVVEDDFDPFGEKKKVKKDLFSELAAKGGAGSPAMPVSGPYGYGPSPVYVAPNPFDSPVVGPVYYPGVSPAGPGMRQPSAGPAVSNPFDNPFDSAFSAPSQKAAVSSKSSSNSTSRVLNMFDDRPKQNQFDPFG